MREPEITINVACPGHAYTAMNKALPTSAYPLVTRPIVPLLRLVMPVRYGGGAIGRAAFSSVHLASDPGIAEVHGAYLNSKAQRAPWPVAVQDRHNREAVWALCAELAG